MKNTGFYMHWIYFILGLIFGAFGVAFALFARTERRDKIYSSLLGCGIGIVISMIFLKFYPANFTALFRSV